MTTAGPFCTVPRCADSAEGAIELRYAHPIRRYLCARHLAPHRVLLSMQLRDPALAPAEPTAPAVVPGQVAAWE